MNFAISAWFVGNSIANIPGILGEKIEKVSSQGRVLSEYCCKLNLCSLIRL
jgi:hypothetical protein